GGTNFIVIPSSVFAFSTNSVTQNGTGTLTLSGANTYGGSTFVNQGTLIAASGTALGSTASGTTVTSGATLGFQGGINYAGAEPVTISGSGVGGVGAVTNVSGNNSFAGPISLAADSTIGSASNTLTLGGNITNGATVNTNLAFTGAGNVTVT